MASPAEIVGDKFALAQTYATLHQGQLTAFTNAMNATLYTPPTVSVTWASLTAPTIPDLPTVPTLPTIDYAGPASTPTPFAEDAPVIVFDDFTDIAPTITLPAAPTVTYGAVPTVPTIGAVTIPTAPTIDAVDAPIYLALSTPTFAGVDLHEAFLANFDNIPTLSLVSPTPYSYSPGPEYASTLLTTLQAVLTTRLAGGTGLDPAVEQALWDRARSRETQIALAARNEVMRNSEAFGFPLPTGVLAAQVREADQNYFDKLSGLSRDIAIKQAELEQANLRDTIAAGMDLEGKLIDQSYKLEALAYDSAKTQAENAIGIFNAMVDQYKALLTAYGVYAEAYRSIISAELAKVEVYKAELSGEQTKADINTAMVNQYKALIEAGLSQVEIYKAQVGGAQTLIELEKAKIGAAGEQIRAFVAGVNAETAKVEAYKATVQGQQALVDIYKTKADVFGVKVGAQADKARAQLGWYSAMSQAKAAEWDGFRAQVGAESERIRALGIQSSSLLDGYKAAAAATEAMSGMATRQWESQIKEYEAVQNYTLQAAKINADAMQFSYASMQDAAKVGAQVYAQLTASSYGMVSASASISGTGSTSVSYSYSNDTTGPVYPKETA